MVSIQLSLGQHQGIGKNGFLFGSNTSSLFNSSVISSSCLLTFPRLSFLTGKMEVTIVMQLCVKYTWASAWHIESTEKMSVTVEDCVLETQVRCTIIVLSSFIRSVSTDEPLG